jgi:hypothetical protein
MGFLDGKKDPPQRWPRRARFRLTASGVSVERDYGVIVSGSRMQGRASSESTLTEWGRPLGLEGPDGLLLAELRQAPRTASELKLALETSGVEPARINAGLGRLLDAGLIETVVPEPERQGP